MTHLIRALLIAGLLAFTLGAAIAEPMDDGKSAYESGDYPAALKIIRPLARQGNATARLYLGVMQFGGLGVKKSEID